MIHGSLFSGIGGFDLAAEWMGWENKFHCEWNPFGQKVLKYYWPDAESFTDITKTDFKKFYGTIDLLSGGFPCQPYSSAGKRKGKDDERHLWPHMLRAIKEIAPRYIVGENVRGLTNWNGGMVFEEVCAQMEDIGYQVAPFLIPASGVGAPHRRDRIWFVATNTKHLRCEQCQQQGQSRCGQGVFEGICDHGIATNTNISTTGPYRTSGSVESNGGNEHLFEKQRGESTELNNRLHEFSRDVANTNSNGRNQRNSNNEVNASERRLNAFGDTNKSNVNGDVTNTNGIGNQSRSWGLSEQFNENGQEGGISTNTANIRRENALENGELERGRFGQSYKRNAWDSFPSVSPICNGDDGISNRLDGITFPKWRNESIKAGGNAIVPQVAFQIFKAIEQYEILTAPATDIRQSL